MLKIQNYANHARYVPMYHLVLFGLLLITFIGSLVNLAKSLGDHQRLYSAALLVAVSVILFFLFYFARSFALKAQDRAIRAEESLRFLVLTGKLPDPRLTIRQLIGLRFASDGELAELAGRAAAENLSEDQIKRAVTSWKSDDYRV